MGWLSGIAIGALVLILLGGVALRVGMGFVDTDPRALAGLDLDGLSDRSRTNTYLIAPPGMTERLAADAPAPVFDVSPEALRDALEAELRGRTRTQVALAEGRVMAVERSLLFRFPDDIVAEPVAVDGGTSLYLYSASRYGRDDLGVNRARVEAILEGLRNRLGE